jgi:2-oxoglutarate ferredoxin oxidoreductase subunit beta
MGSIDRPFLPLSLALGAEATFVARSIDTDRKQLTEVLRAAAAHRGTALVEIYQNCNIYNDGAFDFVREDKTNRIYLEQGQPVRFGENGEKGLVIGEDGAARIVNVADVGESALYVHDAHAEEPHHAFALSRVTQGSHGATPLGVFRDIDRPSYDELLNGQVDSAVARKGAGDLEQLLHGADTWDV